MCPRCYAGFGSHRASRGNTPSLASTALAAPLANQFYCGFISSKKFVSIRKKSNLLTLLNSDNWIQIMQFTNQFDILALVSLCDRLLHHHIEGLWENLCHSLSRAYSFTAIESLDDCFYLLPSCELPASWKRYFILSTRKINLIRFMNTTRESFPKFFMTYRRLQNPNFGTQRIFTQHREVYFMKYCQDQTLWSPVVQEELYNAIEYIQQRSDVKSIPFSLTSGNKICSTFQIEVCNSNYASLLPTVCREMNGSPLQTIQLMIISMVEEYDTRRDSSLQFISFADVAEMLSRTQVSSQTIYLYSTSPMLVMPFEVYFFK